MDRAFRMKTVHNVVSDIYRLVSTKNVPEGVDLDSAIEAFGENVKDLIYRYS